MFFFFQLGSWHPNIPFNEAAEIDDDPPAAELAPNEDQDEDAIEAPQPKKRKYISQTEYFRYRLHPREPTNESQHLFLAQKLLQEFIVDCWAALEQNRLGWVRQNQQKSEMIHVKVLWMLLQLILMLK
ncbi:LOW QUALITY PROTEIN: hypothetical protein CVT25_009412, partial [Psilocybe cyanescens]